MLRQSRAEESYVSQLPWRRQDGRWQRWHSPEPTRPATSNPVTSGPISTKNGSACTVGIQAVASTANSAPARVDREQRNVDCAVPGACLRGDACRSPRRFVYSGCGAVPRRLGVCRRYWFAVCCCVDRHDRSGVPAVGSTGHRHDPQAGRRVGYCRQREASWRSCATPTLTGRPDT
jgi:hypothetical protein